MLESHRIPALVKKHFPQSRMVSVEKAQAGQIDSAYKVSLKDPDTDILIQVFPETDSWKAQKEKKVRALLSKAGVPLPKILHTGTTGALIPNHYQMLEHLPGQRWDEALKDIPQDERKGLYLQLGDALGRIHSVKLDTFGYIHSDQEPVPLQSDWWKEVFLVMCVGELAELSSPQFGELAMSIRDHFDVNQGLVGGKIEPRLLHNNFSSDNILVHNQEGRWSIGGILDFGSAFAGHTEFELSKVVSRLLRDPSSNEYKSEAKDFFKGYEKHVKISDQFEKRRPYYTLYHLLKQVNLYTQNRRQYREAGLDVDQIMDYFYKDINDILSR